MSDDQFASRDAARRRLGFLAQDVALESERRRVREGGHARPEEVVKPVWNEPARGYDILSIELENGEPRFIEVKAASLRGTRLTFFLTANEKTQSRALANYYIYVVIEADSSTPRVFTIVGQQVSNAALTPINYLASFRIGSGQVS